MDEHSDLDIGFVFETEALKSKVWDHRWHWDIAPWFHRFDADHIKEDFIIYFFYLEIKADICLYTPEKLPPQAAAPFKVIWDEKNILSDWISNANTVNPKWKTSQEAKDKIKKWYTI